MTPIRIIAGAREVPAELMDTPTGRAVAAALPLEGQASTWGDEIYFSIPVCVDLEPGAGEEVPVGALAYWPEGPACCIFFGPTPVSVGDEPRAYSPVNVFGHIDGDVAPLRSVQDGETVRIESISG